LAELHERNVKNYPELFNNEPTRTPKGGKDELYAMKDKATVFNSDLEILKTG
jgi:hypothetical protein